MKGWTKVTSGLIQAGDRYSFDGGKNFGAKATQTTWIRGVVADGEHQDNGTYVGLRADLHGWGGAGCAGAWYRETRPSGWISFKDRKPTREDADRQGRILAMNADTEDKSWCDYSWDCEFISSTHWMPLAFDAPEDQPIKVGCRTLVPQKDGSIKVMDKHGGLDATMSAADFALLQKQRERIMKK